MTRLETHKKLYLEANKSLLTNDEPNISTRYARHRINTEHISFVRVSSGLMCLLVRGTCVPANI